MPALGRGPPFGAAPAHNHPFQISFGRESCPSPSVFVSLPIQPFTMQDSSQVAKVHCEAAPLMPAGESAVEAGFAMPVFITWSAWSDCVAWSPDDSRRQLIQNEGSRLRHLLGIAADAFSLNSVPSTGVLFPVYRVPRDGHSMNSIEVVLQAILVTMDGKPVVIIMLQHETVTHDQSVGQGGGIA